MSACSWPGDEQEGRAVGAHVLVLVERGRDPVRAVRVGALADELRARRRRSAARSRRCARSPRGTAPRSAPVFTWSSMSSPLVACLRFGRTAKSASTVALRGAVARAGRARRRRAARARRRRAHRGVRRRARRRRRTRRAPSAASSRRSSSRSSSSATAGRVLALVPGDRRADAAKVAAAAGAGYARVASPRRGARARPASSRAPSRRSRCPRVEHVLARPRAARATSSSGSAPARTRTSPRSRPPTSSASTRARCRRTLAETLHGYDSDAPARREEETRCKRPRRSG